MQRPAHASDDHDLGDLHDGIAVAGPEATF